jgi:DUF2971 family protein
LSQWRAYGGGEGGYAIGFDIATLILALTAENGYLAGVCYHRQTHIEIGMSVVDATVKFYLDGLAARPGVDHTQWGESFLQVWSHTVSDIAPMIKDPAFATENEWRLIHRLGHTDLPNLKFQQRQSMLRRHLPLKLRSPGYPHLPICAVVRAASGRRSRTHIGESRFQLF